MLTYVDVFYIAHDLIAQNHCFHWNTLCPRLETVSEMDRMKCIQFLMQATNLADVVPISKPIQINI